MKIPTHEEVARRAQLLWQDTGCPQGRDTEIWLQAEKQLATEASAALPGQEALLSREAYEHRAELEAAAQRRHEAGAPLTPHIIAPKGKPAETGKPLWSKPHSR